MEAHVKMSLCLFLFVLFQVSEGLKGKKVKCENEGEFMDSAIHGPLRSNSCIRCRCKNKEVVCSKPKCPSMEGCHAVMSDRPKTSCCDVCKGCTYKGTEYKHNETWTDPEHSCLHLQCKAGVVTKSKLQCRVNCKNPTKVPGMCCPVCPVENTRKGDCFVNGKLVRDGESVSLAEDKCATCTCVKGQLSCKKPACPVLNCPHSKIVKDPFGCCSYCEGSEKVFYPKTGECVFRGVLYENGKKFMPDKCTECLCKNGSSVCERNACPVLDCAKSDVVYSKGSCCPACKKNARKADTCLKDGKVLQHGETWSKEGSPCTKCTCTKGKVICYIEQCDKTIKCPNNQILVQKPGECCKKCVDAEAMCTISDAGSKTMNYKTFDGFHYKFDGVCKYLLTKDIKDNSFVVRLQNGFYSPVEVGPKSIQAYIKINATESVSVFIGRGLVVKVNRTRVSLPHEVKGVYSITTDNTTVDLILASGVKIRYDKDGHVRVIVSKAWEKKVSGLCGNYNGLSADDTTGRDGRVYGQDKVFAESWRIGGKCSCDKWVAPKDVTSCSRNVQERIKAHARCDVLRQGEFKECRKLVNVNPYYRTCVENVCQCKPKEGNCECDIIAAYQKACQEQGEYVKLPRGSSCNKGSTKTKATFRKTKLSKKKSRKDVRDKTSLKVSKTAHVKHARPEMPSADDDQIAELLEIKRKFEVALEKTGKDVDAVRSAEEVRKLTGTKVVKKPTPEELAEMKKKKKIDRGTLDFLFGR